MGPIEFRLLGPVSALIGDRPLDLGTTKQRSVLAALLVDVGRTVPTEALIDRVWDEEPPAKVRGVLYAHLSRIRAVLAPYGGTGATLCRESGGYRLAVDPDTVDLHRARRLAARALDGGQPVELRAQLLRQAADLWRGEPLAGLTGGWMGRLRESLRLQHVDLAIAWAGAALAAGDAGSVLARVRPLLAEHPLVEPLAAVLVRALCATGRGVEALDVYRVVADRLAEDLGAEPGPELQALYRQLVKDGVGPQPRTGQPTDRLPRGTAGFVGRAPQLSRLDQLLADAGAADDPEGAGAAPVVALIVGTAGIGKTALALHWARRVADRFPDGQLYVNLRGFDSAGAMPPASALGSLLAALGIPPGQGPADLDGRVDLFRSLLACHRVLVILDNARDAAQVRPLLPGVPGSVAVVTSRDQLTGLVVTDHAVPILLDLVSAGQAQELLARRLGPDRVAAEPVAVASLIAGCAGLPLALSIVAARAATAPQLPLAVLAGELSGRVPDGGAPGGGAPDLDALDGGDPASDLRAVFSWSYRALSQQAGALFRSLGVHPGPDVSVAASVSLTGWPQVQVRRALGELDRAHMLTRESTGRYACHDLLRAYAVEIAHADGTDEERRTLVHRVLDHYLWTACRAAHLLDPQRDPVTTPAAQAGVVPEEPADHDAALAWFTDEHRVLIRAVQLAQQLRLDVHAWQLAWAMYTYLDYRGHWHELVTVQTVALESARRLGDRTGQALSHSNLAAGYARLGELAAAEVHFGASLQLYAEVGSLASQARAHLHLAWLGGMQGRHAAALGYARRASDLYRRADHQAGLALALAELGWYHAQLGEFEPAIVCCGDALAMHRALGDRSAEAATWDSLGFCHHRLGAHEQAVACYREALTLLLAMGDRYNEATVRSHLGDSHLDSGRADAAYDEWCRAVRIFEELGHPDADALRARIAEVRAVG